MTTATLSPADCLAKIDGETRVEGLDGPVAIVRDRWGIPHIEAGTTHDAFFAQGFCIAQDRLWQLELYRSMARGRAAALLNKGLLKLDIQNRRLGFERYAEAEWAAQSPEARMVLQAYADGINAAVATQPKPYEFEVLGHEMQPWSPVDSLAVVKMVNMGAHWAMKLKIGQVAAKLGLEAAQALVTDVPLDSALITPSGARWTGDAHPFKDDIASAMGQPDGPQNSGGGSNCWVIHGSKTATGKPIVCGDPHLALTVPGQWYVVHMECPEFTVAGPCNPCYPGPVFYGHNTKVAWTMTHAMGDRWDVYREKVRNGPGGPEVLFKSSWSPMERRDEEFGVRGGDTERRTTWITRHGPVIFGDPERDDEVIAARWGLADPAHDTDAMLAMLRSSTTAEATAAIRTYDSVSGNFCVADVAGDIAYQYSGRIPKRSPWLLPVPGWDGAHEWDGDVPKDELPAERNPENGFIVTANNRTTTPDYPHYLSFMATPWRAQRLREVLDAVETFAPGEMPALHADQVNIPARDLSARVADVAVVEPGAQRLKGILAGWDGDMSPASPQALAWDALCEALCERTVRAFYAPAINLPEFTVIEQRRILRDQVAADSALMLVNDGSWDDAIARALSAAWADLESRFGPDPAAWRWDAIHFAAWRHNLGRDPEHAETLNAGEVPVGGHADTVFSTMVEHGAVSTHGVSYRQVIDMAEVNAMQICIPPGNSGQPGSPHYADNLERWRTVEYHPLFVDWSDIEANAEARLELVRSEG